MGKKKEKDKQLFGCYQITASSATNEMYFSLYWRRDYKDQNARNNWTHRIVIYIEPIFCIKQTNKHTNMKIL